MTLIRMHGRNVHGWNKPRDADTNWREVRYLYKYNQEELLEWKNRIEELKKDTRDVIILFNNNSGDRKSTHLNSSHVAKSYEDFCLKKRQESLILLNSII